MRRIEAPPANPAPAQGQPTPAMNAAAWPGRRWTLALLLACLGMIGPFAIDAYLPAFGAIAAGIGVGPVGLQQTLSVYLAAFAVMNLFHGALADSFGRRPVVLGGLVVFTLASAGCALADDLPTLLLCRALQGASAGVGMVVTRALIRDLFDAADAQRLMSQVTLFFGIAPAVAPLFGALLLHAAGWQAIFWMLALLGAALALAMARWLPETLPPAARQPFGVRPLLQGYAGLARTPRFLALVAASGLPFNAMFLYVLSAPAFLGTLLGLAPGQFFLFFTLTVAGIMAGASFSGRMAGRVKPRHQIRHGFVLTLGAVVANLVLCTVVAQPPAWAAMLPIALLAFGWSLLTPAVTVLALDQAPERRGMASSVQASASSAANALVAGVVAPLAMGSLHGLALAAAALLVAGLLAWVWVKPRLPREPRAGPGAPEGTQAPTRGGR
jgi:DHA1 family bicyclomycin/chloramphenicol resistance-like MFS transporter